MAFNLHDIQHGYLHDRQPLKRPERSKQYNLHNLIQRPTREWLRTPERGPKGNKAEVTYDLDHFESNLEGTSAYYHCDRHELSQREQHDTL